MIPVAAGVRIWIATGHTDMRKGMNGLALLVQEGLGRDPFAGDVFVFRGRAGSLIKALWHDGIGLSLYAKRLDRGRFVWPATVDGTFATVRHRTIRSKGCLSNRTALAMVFKLLEAAQKSWRRLDGHNQLPKLVLGVTFNNGIEVIAKSTDRQPTTAAA